MTLKKAYIGMQCFWGTESFFAKLSGVTRTKVGYAGGQTLDPDYWNLGDHIEITEVEYDDASTDFNAILSHFWQGHDSTIAYKNQYRSAILYSDEEQKKMAELQIEQQPKKNNGKEIRTLIAPLDRFYQAENFHQKYWLRKQMDLLKVLQLNDQQLVESPLASKLNAFLAGFDDFTLLDQLCQEYNLSENVRKLIRSIAESGGIQGSCRDHN